MRDYEPYYTQDGSIGLYSYADKDVFHSKFGALTEAWEKFVIPANIDKLMREKSEINVLDICYGIGYNTKALMSFVINKNKKRILKKNFLKKSLSNFLNNETIYDNNKKIKNTNLSIHNGAIYSDNSLPLFNIDCLEINRELVKLSPFFKTIKTPEEIFYSIVPNIFDVFDWYYKLKNNIIDIISTLAPKNPQNIEELLDIKFRNMHIDKEYKINDNVNYIILNILYEKFGKDYLNDELVNLLRKTTTRKFFEQRMINYAKFNHICGYNSSSENILSAFLHNIYYEYLSKRDKKIDFKLAQSLFNVSFYLNDARKTILSINKDYDLIFLDAFTYTKAPQLWSFEFIAELYERLTNSGLLLTYSNSAQVRNTLLENNFFVGKIYNEKTRTFVGTIASKDKSKIEHPLNNYELGLCSTKAGIPYHDPNLSFTDKEILEYREYEFHHSPLMSSSKYMKLRGKS